MSTETSISLILFLGALLLVWRTWKGLLQMRGSGPKAEPETAPEPMMDPMAEPIMDPIEDSGEEKPSETMAEGERTEVARMGAKGEVEELKPAQVMTTEAAGMEAAVGAPQGEEPEHTATKKKPEKEAEREAGKIEKRNTKEKTAKTASQAGPGIFTGSTEEELTPAQTPAAESSQESYKKTGKPAAVPPETPPEILSEAAGKPRVDPEIPTFPHAQQKPAERTGDEFTSEPKQPSQKKITEKKAMGDDGMVDTTVILDGGKQNAAAPKKHGARPGLTRETELENGTGGEKNSLKQPEADSGRDEFGSVTPKIIWQREIESGVETTASDDSQAETLEPDTQGAPSGRVGTEMKPAPAGVSAHRNRAAGQALGPETIKTPAKKDD